MLRGFDGRINGGVEISDTFVVPTVLWSKRRYAALVLAFIFVRLKLQLLQVWPFATLSPSSTHNLTHPLLRVSQYSPYTRRYGRRRASRKAISL
jgi:hypothetical protein